jgi:hypothetical protein
MPAAFPQFPKQRPPLPEPYAGLYAAAVRANRRGETAAALLSRWMESWMHRQVARDLACDRRPRNTLEIGAGTLNQLPYERVVGDYDIVEPTQSLYQESPHRARIRAAYGDIGELPEDAVYDRITSIATFEHLTDLPRVVARAGLLLAPCGELRVAIPSEGMPLWTLGWQVTTGLEFRLRHGLDYGVLMRHEHVNTAAEIGDMLRYFFGDVRCRVRGVSRRCAPRPRPRARS